MKRVFILFSMLILAAFEAYSSEEARLRINFYDRTIYYPGESEVNPVWVKVSVKNDSAQTMRFKVASDRAHSIDFLVCSVKNIELPETKALLEKRTTSRTVYFRELALEPGEEYSFKENLKDFVDIASPGIYYIQAKFYPELYGTKSSMMTSNQLTLEVRPSQAAASSFYLPVEAKTLSILKAENIAPDLVVERTINARQKELWDEYFLYMDVESMLKRNADRKREYNLLSGAERDRMLENYKADLMLSRIDRDIVALPEKFEIEKTLYNRDEGEVVVIEWFKYNTYKEKKRYTYKVRMREGVWHIYDYTVTNLGTE